jgi:excisionase family DNA binding protein
MRVAPDPNRRLLTIAEVMAQLGGVSRSHLYVLFESGQLKPIKLGRRTFVASDQLDRYIAALVA